MNFFKKCFFAVMLVIFATSCSDDDSSESDNRESVSINEADLAGTWNLVGITTENGRTVTEVLGQSVASNFSSFAENIDYLTVFETNPNIVSGEGSYDVTTTTSTSGQEFTQTLSIDTDSFNNDLLTGTWGLNDDGTSLIVTANGNTSEGRIIEFSENRLVYVLDLSDGVIQNDESNQIEGVSTMVTGSTTVTLTR